MLWFLYEMSSGINQVMIDACKLYTPNSIYSGGPEKCITEFKIDERVLCFQQFQQCWEIHVYSSGPQADRDVCHYYCNLNSNSEPNTWDKVVLILKTGNLKKASKQRNKQKTCLIWFGKYSVSYISEGTDEIIQFFKAYPEYCKYVLTYSFILFTNCCVQRSSGTVSEDRRRKT